MSKPIPCCIKTLAPLHLGADEVYEPLGFVIDEEHHRLVAFEPWSFLEKLSEADRRKFSELCLKGTVASILDIYRFFRDRRHAAQGRAVAVSPGLTEHYRKVLEFKGRDLDIQKTINQFTIHRTAFLAADQRPYLPGSAVKGALRTAYLNALSKIKPMKTPRDEQGRYLPRALEQNLLNYQKIDEDPFRLLKISDFLPVGEVKTRIIYAVNEKKRPSHFAARGPYQILEVIEPGALFAGTIAVENYTPDLRRLAPIRHFLEQEELWEGALAFYRQEKQREDQELHELGLPRLALDVPPGGLPLRLGRHGGAESFTIEGHRKIKILQGKGQPPKELNHATTLWLAADYHQREKRHTANLRPFGWAALGELSPEEARGLAAREETWQGEAQGAAVQPSVTLGKVTTAATPAKPAAVSPEQEVWEGATLSWSPGDQRLTAAWQGKKARCQGKELAPEALHKLLFVQRKSVSVRVKVAKEGNAFRIEGIEVL
jgi:CRISPR-associated protein Csm5